MALSNILKEPRREITETVIGVGMVGSFVFADFYFCHWLMSGIPEPIDRFMCTLLSGAVVLPLGVAAVCGAFVAAHALGDGICNRLARVGADPRPTQRYR